ncbi:MAG: hypothetical protein K2X62_07435 [Beijerinckiaceae bacterium]|jgi:hypothetical protein|nr:hypothetical protein [Beijerinckiaceae bacterium]
MKIGMSVIAASVLMSTIATAADLQGRKVADATAPEASVTQVPGDDIFGYTSATDVGSVGDTGMALENDGRLGKRDGRYRVLSQKLEFARTFAENWSGAVSVFGDWRKVQNVSIFGIDRSGYQFDGMSVELRHRVIERAVGQPFALTLALEPRWGRVDGGSGLRADSLGLEGKVQIDAPINERLFWAMNVNFATGRQQDPLNRSDWIASSGSAVSTALTYAVVDEKLYLGAEARWLQGWDRAFFGSLTGHAVYVGPTLLVKPAANVALNVTFQPQVAGKATGVPGRLDLDSFERANFRAKLAVAF